MAGLKLGSVNKVYPSGTMSLFDMNFGVNEGEFIVVLGGDGSGKSTLLKVIAGLEDASSGTVEIDGKDVTDAEPKDRNVAMVFRSNTLYPALNVFDNMAFGLKLRKAPAALIEQRVKAAAEILGLTEVLYRKPKTLTAAQRQRVAVGRAIVREPKLYLFDEPLAGLDDKLAAELLNVIVNLQARMQGAFVYATKNVSEALTIGTRIIVLKNGFIQQIDTPANLYDYPANAYVAFYIGSPTINFINKAEIVRDENGVYACEGALKIKLADSIVKRFSNIDEYAGTGKKVVIGIRPEDASTGTDGFDAVCVKTEGEGGVAFAECEADGHALTVKCGGTLNRGDATKISVDGERLYLFDGETRLTLLERDGGYAKTDFAEADYKPLSFAEEESIKEKFTPKKQEKKKR